MQCSEKCKGSVSINCKIMSNFPLTHTCTLFIIFLIYILWKKKKKFINSEISFFCGGSCTTWQRFYIFTYFWYFIIKLSITHRVCMCLTYTFPCSFFFMCLCESHTILQTNITKQWISFVKILFHKEIIIIVGHYSTT